MKKLLQYPIVKKLLISLGILISIILVFDFILLPLYVSGSELKVPNVVGMTEEEAFQTLEDENFNPSIADTSFGVSLPPGRVFLQKPESGKIVKEGRTVYLFISGGEQLISVPLLKGKSVGDARLSLERIGLKLGAIEELASTHPKDMVFDQQFAEGTNLRKGQSIGISVSIGKGGGDIEVPDLIGKSLSEARIILSDSSLTVGKINYQISSTLLPNTVLDQYPAPGNKLNSGNTVDLFITKEGTIQERDEFLRED
ncbi:MAG: PASTA domain-containing protein [Ignavibacterium sp.]|jgi:serine/threonine-protein kinase|nr:PASTA domain-containing protein [Ignavibacterium sp.]